MSKVICAGESLIDFVCDDRDSNLITGTHFIKKAGGAPANVCVAIRKMGVESYILGTVGDDQFGDFLIESVKKYDVNTDMLMKMKGENTTLAFVSLTTDGERDFRFNRGADSSLEYNMLDEKVLHDANVYHFGSATAFLGGNLQATYYQLLEKAIATKKIVSFDPNYRDALFGDKEALFIEHCLRFIKVTDILKVSDDEARIITNEQNIEKAAQKLVELGAKNVLVTLGSKGTLICTAENLKYVEVEPVKMVDATGAGDAFIGSVIADISRSEDLSYEKMIEYVKRANKVGAMTVQNIGALDSIPYLEDL